MFDSSPAVLSCLRYAGFDVRGQSHFCDWQAVFGAHRISSRTRWIPYPRLQSSISHLASSNWPCIRPKWTTLHWKKETRRLFQIIIAAAKLLSELKAWFSRKELFLRRWSQSRLVLSGASCRWNSIFRVGCLYLPMPLLQNLFLFSCLTSYVSRVRSRIQILKVCPIQDLPNSDPEASRGFRSFS